MSSKFQPGEETFDDVSGHRIHVRPDDEETEGHRKTVGLVDEEETEGHRLSHNLVDDEETEGHRIPYNTGLPSDDDEGTEVRAWEKGWQYKLFGARTPGYDQLDEHDTRIEANERVRLLYVAMTRARDRLVMLGN